MPDNYASRFFSSVYDPSKPPNENFPILNNFASPYSMGWPTGTPINGQTLNNFPSPYSMGAPSGAPVIDNTRNNFASPYSMGQPGTYSGGYSAQNGYTGALPNYGAPVGGNSSAMLAAGAPAGTTDTISNGLRAGSNLTGGTPQNTPTGGTMPTGNPSNFNLNPSPTRGQGAFGLVPGTIGLPPSTFQQTIGAAPGLGGETTNQLTRNIIAELNGVQTEQEKRNMQDLAAHFGVSSGMPGTNAIPGSLAYNKNLLGNILTTRDIQQQGQKDYLSALSGIGAQQLSPALMAEIEAHNAQLLAAPDPQTASERMLNNYYNALNRSKSPAGGTGQNPFGAGGAGGGTGGGALGFGFGSLGQNPSQGNRIGAAGGDINPVTGQPYNYAYDPNVNPETGYGTGQDLGLGYGGAASNPDYWNFTNDFGLGTDNTQYDNPEWDFYGG